MAFLLDTSIIQELAQPYPNNGLVVWVDSQPEETLFISVLTLSAIQENLERLENSSDRKKLSDWLRNDLLIRFSGRINEITLEVSLQWASLISTRNQSNRWLSISDSMHLVMARTFDQILVTSNEDRFEGLGIRCFNPFSRQ